MLRKQNGPSRYEQWVAALSRPLSTENAEYMVRGKCNNTIYPAIFNKLSDYVTDAFNSASSELNRFNGSDNDLVFALKRLNAVYRTSLFFRNIDWINRSDKSALTSALKTAALATVTKLQPQAENNPDILFECMALARTANGEM